MAIRGHYAVTRDDQHEADMAAHHERVRGLRAAMAYQAVEDAVEEAVRVRHVPHAMLCTLCVRHDPATIDAALEGYVPPDEASSAAVLAIVQSVRLFRATGGA